MTATDIASSLRQVFSTLHELQKAESGEIELPKTQESPPPQALTPQDSIQSDKVIWDEPERVQKKIWVHNEDTSGSKILDHGQTENCQGDGIAGEAQTVPGGEKARESRSVKTGGNCGSDGGET